jgi:septin family protein
MCVGPFNSGKTTAANSLKAQSRALNDPFLQGPAFLDQARSSATKAAQRENGVDLPTTTDLQIQELASHVKKRLKATPGYATTELGGTTTKKTGSIG